MVQVVKHLPVPVLHAADFMRCKLPVFRLHCQPCPVGLFPLPGNKLTVYTLYSRLAQLETSVGEYLPFTGKRLFYPPDDTIASLPYLRPLQKIR